MTARLERAGVLIAQQRYQDARQELEAVLGDDPDQAVAHSMLGLCLQVTGDPRRALEEAREGVALAPDAAYGHYILGIVLFDQDDLKGALASVREAQRLDPLDADVHALEGRIHLRLRKWESALEAADRGLALDAEHVSSRNVRATALARLGRKAEAGETLDAALARDPDNAETHLNVGWRHLEQGRTREALESFREALRLDPTMDAARQGIVEALKARHLLYRGVLAYFLWMARLSDRARWFVVIGAYIVYRVVDRVADSNPELAPYLGPVMGLYIAFVLLSWLASPVFDLMLRLHPVGRYALSERQVRAANCIGALLGIAVVGGIGYFASGSELAGTSALAAGALAFPAAGYFQADRAGNRRFLLVYLLAVAALAVSGAALAALGRDLGYTLLVLAILGGVLSTWVVNIAIMREK